MTQGTELSRDFYTKNLFLRGKKTNFVFQNILILAFAGKQTRSSDKHDSLLLKMSDITQLELITYK